MIGYKKPALKTASIADRLAETLSSFDNICSTLYTLAGEAESEADRLRDQAAILTVKADEHDSHAATALRVATNISENILGK